MSEKKKNKFKQYIGPLVEIDEVEYVSLNHINTANLVEDMSYEELDTNVSGYLEACNLKILSDIEIENFRFMQEILPEQIFLAELSKYNPINYNYAKFTIDTDMGNITCIVDSLSLVVNEGEME